MIPLRQLGKSVCAQLSRIDTCVAAVKKTVGYRLLWPVALVVCGMFIGPCISSVIQGFTTRHLTSERLICTMSPIFRCGLLELDKVTRELGIDQFDLSLDDPIVTNYCLVRFRVANGATAIRDPLRLAFSCGSPKTKIVSIQKKILEPRHKGVEVIDSLPNAQWIWPKDGVKVLLSWRYPGSAAEDDIAGFNVYRSLLRDRGYGRANTALITTCSWSPLEEVRPLPCPVYYKVAAVNTIGEEGDLSEPFEMANLAPISSFKTRMETQSPRESGSAQTSAVSGSDGMPRMNRVELSFLSGLDAHAEVEFFLLCKALPNKVLSSKLWVTNGPQRG